MTIVSRMEPTVKSIEEDLDAIETKLGILRQYYGMTEEHLLGTYFNIQQARFAILCFRHGKDLEAALRMQ